MLIEFHDHLQKPLVLKASRVLVTTDDGTPIAFVVEYAPGHYRAFHAGDKEFAAQLRLHKVDRTVLVNHLPLKGTND